MSDQAELIEKDKILTAGLPDIIFDGWSLKTFQQSAQKMNISTEEVAQHYPNGISDIISHFQDWAIRQTLNNLNGTELKSMRIRDRILFLVTHYFKTLEPYKEAVRSLMAHLALPQNIPLGTQLLFKVADRLWYAAGDQATDFNYYTKRGLLAGVLSSTTFVWLGDSSEGYTVTKEFIDRQISRVMRLGKIASVIAHPEELFKKFSRSSREK